MNAVLLRRSLNALAVLSTVLFRRLVREGLVVRSLVFPILLTAGTLMATLGVVALVIPPPLIAVAPGGPTAALAEDLAPFHFLVAEDPDPKQAVFDRRAAAGTDGKMIWSFGATPASSLVEQSLRARSGAAAWQLEALINLPSPEDAKPFGQLIARLLSGVYVLYGVVFGAGMVARDRDDGTLSAELALPIPRFIPGLARWGTGSLVLAAFTVAALLVFDALIGIPGVWAMSRHAAAAAAAATAIGLFSAGGSGLRDGFGGSLAIGLVAALVLYVVGQLLPGADAWVPISSLGQTEGGWSPMLLSLGAGALASWRFARVQA